jgi:hypothetical protein
MNKNNGKVNIHGREYETVALRVQKFKAACPDHSLTTEVLTRDAECVVMKASIFNPEGRLVATGHAEEYRKASSINKTSALENAETSAIGRALAAFGLGGTEFATADEVANAIGQQKAQDQKAAPVVIDFLTLPDQQQELVNTLFDISQQLPEVSKEKANPFNDADCIYVKSWAKDEATVKKAIDIYTKQLK